MFALYLPWREPVPEHQWERPVGIAVPGRGSQAVMSMHACETHAETS